VSVGVDRDAMIVARLFATENGTSLKGDHG